MLGRPACALRSPVAAAAGSDVQTYRTIGPDGKVTYSDRMPTDPQVAHARAGPHRSPPRCWRPSDRAVRPAPGHVAPAGQSPTPSRRCRRRCRAGGGRQRQALPARAAGGGASTSSMHQFFMQNAHRDLRPPAPRLRRSATTACVRNWRDRNSPTSSPGATTSAFTRFSGRAARHPARHRPRAHGSSCCPPSDASTEADKTASGATARAWSIVRRQIELVGDAQFEPIVEVDMRLIRRFDPPSCGLSGQRADSQAQVAACRFFETRAIGLRRENHFTMPGSHAGSCRASPETRHSARNRTPNGSALRIRRNELARRQDRQVDID